MVLSFGVRAEVPHAKNAERAKDCCGVRSPEMVAEDGAEFSASHVASIRLRLKAGANDLLVKNLCGSVGSGFCVHLNLPEGVVVSG